jgi:integrase
MKAHSARLADVTKILTRREIATLLAELRRKAPRSKNTQLNLVIFRLACCCGLRASEIAMLQVADVRTSCHGRISESVTEPRRAADLGQCRFGGMPARWRILKPGGRSSLSAAPGPNIHSLRRFSQAARRRGFPDIRCGRDSARPARYWAYSGSPRLPSITVGIHSSAMRSPADGRWPRFAMRQGTRM